MFDFFSFNNTFVEYSITGSIIATIIVLIVMEIKKYWRKMDLSNFVLRQPISYFGTAILCSLISCAGILFTRIHDFQSIIITLLFFIVGVILFSYCIRWKLEVKEDQIILTPFIGKKKLLLISSITKVKVSKLRKDLIAFSEDKMLFSIEYTCKGYDMLLSRLKQERIKFE